MSLPKRDGVKGRYYLIHKPDTSPEDGHIGKTETV